MSSSLLHISLQAPGSVSSAQLVPKIAAWGQDRLLILHDTHITACSVNRQGLEQHQTWRAPASIAQLVCLPSGHLVMLTSAGHCTLHSLAAAGDAVPELIAHTVLQPAQDGLPNERQPFGSVISNIVSGQTVRGVASLLAVAHQESALHIARVSRTNGGSMTLDIKAIPHKQVLLRCIFPDLSGSPLLSVRVHSRVLALQWLSTSEQQLDVQGNSLLAVLHEFSPSSQLPVLHVDCLAVDWQEGSLSPGPWALRNIHPTSRLLQLFPGHGQLPAGTMIISSKGVLLCSCVPAAGAGEQPGSSKAAATPLGVDVQKLQLVQWSLQGVPLCCAAVAADRYIVGDDRAGLYILHIPTSGQATWQPVATAAPLAVPHVLVYIPLNSNEDTTSSSRGDAMELDVQEQQQQQLSGFLFIGSQSSSSQVLGLPGAATHAELPKLQQQKGVSCPLLQSSFLPSLAGAQAVDVLKDPTGAIPEQQLMVACGAAPDGKLAVVRSGMGITPLTLDGPQLPGDAVLFPIEDHPPCNHQQQQHHQPQPQGQQQQQHDLLCFSFPSAGMTEVLSLAGSTFRQLVVPGVHQDQPALLMAGLPGGWLLQVTSDAVLVIDKHGGKGVQHSWTPEGSFISLAAVSGSQLVLACGDRLTALAVDCCGGSLQHVGSCQLQQQASALALLKLSGGSTIIAVGLWVDNQLLLLPWPAVGAPEQLVVGCVVDLQEDQARSVAMMPVGADDVLLVGTNNGTVLMWHVLAAIAPGQRQQQSASGPNSSQWMLSAGRRVQVSTTSVSLELVWVPDTSSSGSTGAKLGVYAHAGGGVVFSSIADLVQYRQTLLQQHSSGGGSDRNVCDLAPTDCVRVSRVCGTEGTLTATVIHTPEMPHSLSWVSASSTLCFGGLDSRHKLRWRSRPLQGAPLATAVHRATNTIVLLLQADFAGAYGWTQQQLVFLDGRSLSVLAVVALAPGHSYTTLAVLELPCTSLQRQAKQQTASTASAEPDVQPSCMPFIILGTRVHLNVASTAADAPAPVAARAAADGSAALPFESTAFLPSTAGPADVGKAGSYPTISEVGMLSVFELRTQLAAADSTLAGCSGVAGAPDHGTVPAVKSELRYQLVMHGMVPLPNMPASLCTVMAQPLLASPQQEQQEPTGKQRKTGESSKSAAAAGDMPGDQSVSASQPYLCVGSEAGVTLYDVMVDNAGSWSAAKVQDALAQAAQVSGVDWDASADAAQHRAIEQQHQQPQHQQPSQLRVSMMKLSSTGVLSGGVVVALRSSSSSIIAVEALGSVTVMRAIASGHKRVQLLPVGADRTGLMAMDVAVAQTAPAAATVLPAAGKSAAAEHGSAPGDGAADQAGPPTAADDVGSAAASHQALLVATHPEGLLLLQRDLAAEQQHQQLAHEAAVGMYEAGLTPDDMLLWQQQQQEMLQAAVQPWLGAGEAAPWAAAGVQGRPQPHHMQAEAGGRVVQRMVLATTAAVAGGTGPLGVVNPGADEAPRLVPSAACAPAPGTSIMCAAQLGIHFQPLHDDAAGSSTSRSRSLAFAAAEPVWCFSSSGAVSVVQLLQAAEAQSLLHLQKQLMQHGQHSSQKHQVLQVQPGAWDGQLLRQLHKLGPSASYRNYSRVRSIRAGMGADQHEAEEDLPFNCVDGDLLLATEEAASQQQADAQHLRARLLQHRLWQAVL